jgi:HNH endonuclease
MRCLVTKAAEPVDVAHIFPFSMRDLRQPLTLSPNSFWSVLRLFWTQDRIDEWYDAIFSSSAGTEVVSNLMCLCPNVHRYHERAFFALKPIEISDDKKSLKVQFYWLLKCKHSNSVDILRVPTIPGNSDGKLRDIGLWNVKTDQRIRSGA